MEGRMASSRLRWALGMLVLFAIAGSARAAYCRPGTGLKNFDFFGFLGGVVRGGDDDASCKPCGAWEASPGGTDARCELCVPLLSTPNLFKTACDCLPGTYVGETTADATVGKNCVPCGPNAVSSAKNAQSCTQCPDGAVAGKNNKCSCPIGYKATGLDMNGVTGCEKCGEGLVSPGGLSDSCDACPAYSTPLATGDFCGCLPGTKLNSSEPFSCAPCTTVFEYTGEANRLLMCKQCFPFSYATADHTSCECAGGYYAADPSAVPLSCKPCPKGTYKAAPGNDFAACVACPAGLEPSGSGKSCVAPLCPPGTETAADGSCTPCPETHFNYMRNGRCTPCPSNTLANPERSKCDICKDGYLQTSESGQELACMSCMFGWIWNETTQACDVDPDPEATHHALVAAQAAQQAPVMTLKKYATGQVVDPRSLGRFNKDDTPYNGAPSDGSESHEH